MVTLPDSILQGLSELERRLEKIREEHDIVAYHLKTWVEKAEAVVNHTSKICSMGYFGRPFLDGLTSLDQISMLLYKVHMLLTEEEYFNNLHLPGVTTGPFAYPFPHHGAEAPPQDADGCGPSAPPPSSNVPSSVASFFVSDDPHRPRTLDPAVQPLPRLSQPPATAPTEPLMAEVRGTPAPPAPTESPTIAAASQTVNPLPGGILSPLSTSDRASLDTESSEYTTPTDGESEVDLHSGTPTPTASRGPSAPASPEPVAQWDHGTGSHQMSPPLYSASRSATPPAAAHTYAAEDTNTTLHPLDAQPMTTDTGLPSVSATPVCTETPAGAMHTEADGMAPQPVTASPPASESASGKANGDISTEAAALSEEDEPSEGAGGLCSDSRASQEEEPTVSPGCRDDGEAGGEASSPPPLVPYERASVAGAGDSVEPAASCTSAHFEIPSANLVDLGSVHEVVVSHYKTPSSFWLQFRSSGAVLDTMTSSLRDHCDAVGPPTGFEDQLGRFCAARYTADQFWYRAKVLKQVTGYVRVSYVDFGNSELVKLEDMRPLDKSHTLLPAQALHCAIKLPVAVKGEWPLASVRQFQKMLEGAEHLEAEFLWRDRRSNRYIVKLLSRPAEGQAAVNLSEEFLAQPVDPMPLARALLASSPQAATAPAVLSPPPLALRPAVPPGTSVAAAPQTPTGAPRVTNLMAAVAARQWRLHSMPSAAGPSVGPPPKIPPAVLPDQDSIPVVISVLFSPAKFYVIPQTEDGLEKKLEDMQREMGRWALRSNPPAVHQVTEGTFWFCLYEHDRKWYRARVIEDAVKDCPWLRARVSLVDYGSVCMVPLWNMRPLPAHLAELPACAHRMSLAFVVPRGMGEDGDGGEDKWDEEVTKLFLQNTGLHTVLIAERRGQRQLGYETVHDVLLWNRNCQPAMNINLLLLEGNQAVLKPQAEEEREAKGSP